MDGSSTGRNGYAVHAPVNNYKMKTIEEIKEIVASECGEKHFEVLLDAEISVGDYEAARALLMTVVNRYIDQHVEKYKKSL